MKTPMIRSSLFTTFLAAVLVTAGCQCSNQAGPGKSEEASTTVATAQTPLQTKESQAAMTPQQALTWAAREWDRRL